MLSGASISKGFSCSHSSCIFFSVSWRWSLLAKDYTSNDDDCPDFSTNLENNTNQENELVPLLSNTLQNLL